MNLTRDQIDALPNDPAALKRSLQAQRVVIDSYEEGKRNRARAAEIAESSPAASFQSDVLTFKSQLEGLSDGSEDYADPRTRGNICRDAIKLVDALFAAVPKA